MTQLLATELLVTYVTITIIVLVLVTRVLKYKDGQNPGILDNPLIILTAVFLVYCTAILTVSGDIPGETFAFLIGTIAGYVFTDAIGNND